MTQNFKVEKNSRGIRFISGFTLEPKVSSTFDEPHLYFLSPRSSLNTIHRVSGSSITMSKDRLMGSRLFDEQFNIYETLRSERHIVAKIASEGKPDLASLRTDRFLAVVQIVQS